ncbi:MAG TPA: EamA family transporter [Verrucomicrobiae bacterium]|jgi:drug/metabolite transporter (DMT)-like permease|nr:EamA family transporter [Verrucomicrobiae bacterium]
MNSGYLLLFAGLIAFGMLGIFHKVADHPQCRPKMIAVILFFWGGILTAVYTAIANPRGLVFPRTVLLIGSFGGVVAALALFLFQTGLKYGKISTSWLIINLATCVPILLSIFLFGEKLNLGKITGMALALTAVIMLWWDKRTDLVKAGIDADGNRRLDAAKWLPLMMLAFLGQGLATSSQKALVEAKQGDYVWQFYIVLYSCGFLVMLIPSIRREAWPNRREIATGLIMALCSVIGNVSITMALKNVRGVVAYPISNGGSLTLVVLAGVLFFKERLHPVGIAGVICGISAILVLVLA